jgi:hypothetical protein
MTTTSKTRLDRLYEIVDQVQYDKSGGQGHCWVNATEDNLPADVQEEIAAEIIDGRHGSVSDYTASNGQHYRWM